MSELKEIKRPIAVDIKHYEELVIAILNSDSPYVNAICEYVISNRGKQMRPLLCLLSAALNGGITSHSHMAASMIELIHTATLIHDDVVDQSDLRRGRPSVKAKWDSRTAVLVGDFIFARAYFHSIANNGWDIIAEITRSIHEVGEGELMQSEQSRNLSMTPEMYFRIIGKKTASLIGASAAAGAISAGASQEKVSAMKEFGFNLGIAFQIKDDILDYYPAEITGKPGGGDIRERKINLPMLHLLCSSAPEVRTEILKKIADAENDESLVAELCNMVESAGGLEYAEKIIGEYTSKALDFLKDYPQSDILDSLRCFAAYVVSRKK